MPFEKTPSPSHEKEQERKEKILPETPRLRHLKRVFGILRSAEKDELGEDVSWQELAREVKPFSNGLELSDNIRDVVINFISKKTPALTERVPSLKKLGQKGILQAIAENEFGTWDENIKGTRREILLATAAHIVKRIENYTYREVLADAPAETLEKLGLDGSTRDLLLDVLKISIKADPLYIRFMAYSQLSPAPSEKAGPVSFSVLKSETLHTLPELFPHETFFLSQEFKRIAKESEAWEHKPGGDIFKQYIETLAASYENHNPSEAENIQKEVEARYEDLLHSDFPIIITPATEGYYKEPYFDPELKISVATPDAKKEEQKWMQAKHAMAESMHELDVDRFSEELRQTLIRGVTVFGGFGVNVAFDAVAQEKPSILIFVNTQIRAYDREFPGKVQAYIKPEESQPAISENSRDVPMLEEISRTNTVLHELSHSIYPDDSPEAKRIGQKALTILDEVKAEICYRPLVPSIIAKKGLMGTKELWAKGMLTESIQMMQANSKRDPYYYAAAYSMNNLFKKNAVVIEENKAIIKDFDLYYAAQKEAAKKILAVYEDSNMTARKALRWITSFCTPNKQVEYALDTLSKNDKQSEKP